MEVEPLPVDPDVEPRARSNREPLSWGIKLLMVGALVLAIGSALVLRGSFTHFLVFLSCFLLAIAVSGIAAACAAIGHRRRGEERDRGIYPKIVAACVAIAIACAMQLMGYAIGESLLEMDVHAAQRYCEQELAPRLDAFYEANGFYPRALGELLGDAPEPPRLLEGRLDDVYQSERDGYAFTIDDPRALFFGTLFWTSGQRGWRKLD